MKRINGVSNLKYLAKGSRGIVYTGVYKGRKVAVKTKNPESTADKRIENEAVFLQIMNAQGVGPKLLFHGQGFFVYEFQEGEYFDSWVKGKKRGAVARVLKNLLEQAFIIDALGIDKEEFHRPLKNVIVKKGGIPVLIDFERCHYSERPKNVTQLMQFAMALGMPKLNRRAVRLLKEYKKNIRRKEFKKIKGLVSGNMP